MRIAGILADFFFLLLILTIVSCNRYIDSVTSEKNIPVYQGHLSYYVDSNALVFKSNIGVKLDKEKYSAKPFYVKLPKGLVSYQISNGETFSFYYKKGQAVSIVINLAEEGVKKDTSYEPNRSEIEKYITHFTSDKHQKYNLLNIEYKQERKQLMIKKDAAAILLYNILPENYDLVVEYLKGFKFL